MWYRITAFIAFYFRALTKFNIHSTFLYDFINHVLDTSKEYYSFILIEKERKRLKKTTTAIHLKDYGAGSSINNQATKTINQIADTALSDPQKCRMLFNMANHYRPQVLLELGTSLGISSSYLASAQKSAQVFTFEGDAAIALQAKEVHHRLGLQNIEVVVGAFSNTLSNWLPDKKIDFVFLDGHHTEKATLQYFNEILPRCRPEAIIIVDDIYWSKEMTLAWRQIIAHPSVSLTIDLYDVGIVFLNKALSRQNITYIPYKYKPWRIGLFG